MEYIEVIEKLHSLSNRGNIEKMKRFGINANNALGISIPDLRKIARRIGKDNTIAIKLFDSEIHEAKILATMISSPKLITSDQMNRWVNKFNSWDICDQCCGNLFVKTPLAYQKAIEWSKSNKEFVKRAGYVMMAELAIHDKVAQDSSFIHFFDIIKQGSTDERNFVKKSVNWALRQIGKRNIKLNKLAIKTAEEIKDMDSKSAKWIATDALRELKSKKF